WQHLARRQPELSETIAVAPWPSGDAAEADPAEEDMALLIDVVKAIRNLRSERNVAPGRRISAAVRIAGREELINQHGYLVAGLANVQLSLPADRPPAGSVRLLVRGSEVYLSDLFDMTAERARLTEELALATSEAGRADAQLKQPGFAERAPQPVIQKARDRLSAAQDRTQKLQQQLRELG
ncbi:MAG: class I tRNA ligase family protein, partial [Chloroflexota bacterium]|nr:class I tRNA ligase family protein [Chloroflexota bacterium]